MSSSEKRIVDPLAEVRHDLRTPVNHILGFSEMLQEDAEANGHGEYVADLQKIQHAARALNALIEKHLTGDGTLLAVQESALAPEVAPAVADAGRASTPHESRRTSAARESAEILEKDGAAADAQAAPLTGFVLAVDDDAKNLEVLARRLERQGLRVETASGGLDALEKVGAQAFDAILLDVMMPDLDGLSVLRRIKEQPTLSHIPVIMLSALDEIDVVIRCVEAGAEDYLPKPVNPTLLRARLSTCLEKKFFRDHEQEYLQTIERTQARLAQELKDAARYVQSIFPERLEQPLRIDWQYQPSGELGGDAFGYHWIDDEHLALYLLDVCGHGVNAALLSVAAINVLRAASLPQTDFRDPGSVLASLNVTFAMEKHNNMYFTIWYGVYHVPSRQLRHAAGGHPPALLITPDPQTGNRLQQVASSGLMIGAVQEVTYPSQTITVAPGSIMYILSDGCYEIDRPDNSMLDFDEFQEFMRKHGAADSCLEQLREWVTGMHGPGPLDDDFSILRIVF